MGFINEIRSSYNYLRQHWNDADNSAGQKVGGAALSFVGGIPYAIEDVFVGTATVAVEFVGLVVGASPAACVSQPGAQPTQPGTPINRALNNVPPALRGKRQELPQLPDGVPHLTSDTDRTVIARPCSREGAVITDIEMIPGATGQPNVLVGVCYSRDSEGDHSQLFSLSLTDGVMPTRQEVPFTVHQITTLSDRRILASITDHDHASGGFVVFGDNLQMMGDILPFQTTLNTPSNSQNSFGNPVPSFSPMIPRGLGESIGRYFVAMENPLNGAYNPGAVLIRDTRDDQRGVYWTRGYRPIALTAFQRRIEGETDPISFVALVSVGDRNRNNIAGEGFFEIFNTRNPRSPERVFSMSLGRMATDQTAEITMSPDGGTFYIATQSATNDIVVVNFNNGMVTSLNPDAQESDQLRNPNLVRSISLRADGRYMAYTNASNGKIYVVNPENGQILRDLYLDLDPYNNEPLGEVLWNQASLVLSFGNRVYSLR